MFASLRFSKSFKRNKVVFLLGNFQERNAEKNPGKKVMLQKKEAICFYRQLSETITSAIKNIESVIFFF